MRIRQHFQTKLFVVTFMPIIGVVFFSANQNSLDYLKSRPMSLDYDLGARLGILFLVGISIGILALLLSRFELTHRSNASSTLYILVNCLLLTLVVFRISNNDLFSKALYRFFRISYTNPSFADFRTIVYGISCEGVKVIGDSITCDPRIAETVWNYPTVLLSLRPVFTPFSETGLTLIVTLSIFASIATLLIGYFRKPYFQKLFFSTLLVTPPSLLAIERMNLDFMIFPLLVIAAVLFSGEGRRRYAAFPIVALAGLLKFYAVVGLFALFLMCRNYKERFLAIGFLATSLILLSSDLGTLNEYVGRDMIGAVGLPVVTSLYAGSTRSALGPISLVCIFILLFMSKLLNGVVSPADIRRYQSPLSFLPAVCFLFTWVSSSSYYYRLILLMPFVVLLVTSQNRIERSIGILSTASFFCSPSILGVLQNLFLLPITSLVFLCLIKLLVKLLRQSVI